MTSKKLQTLDGGKVVPIESEDTQLDFASVRIGAAKGVLSQFDANTMQVDKRLRAAAGVQPEDLATVGQVESSLNTIATNPAPTVATATIGTLMNPWGGFYIKDTATAQVYLLRITNGIVDYAEVP